MRKLLRVLAVVLLIVSMSYVDASMVRFGRNFVLIYPSADGTVTNWTKNTTNYFDAVDEAADASGNPAGDGDTTYIEAAENVTSTAIFDLTNSATYAASNTAIRFVTFVCQGRRANDLGSGTALTRVDFFVRISSTNYAAGSATFLLLTDATFTATTKLYTNPATSLPWTASDIDGMQMYVERVATAHRYDARVTALAIVVAYDRVFTTVPATRLHGAGS
jgi:hypothetical protein